MNWVLLVLLVGICAGMLAWGMRVPGRIYEFPCLAAATMAAFVMPQTIGLLQARSLPDGALEQTMVMAILALGACWAGHVWVRRPLRLLDWSFHDSRLLIAGGALTLLGACFYAAVSRLPEAGTGDRMWSGLPVAYLFFAEVLAYGFALAVTLYLLRPAPWALLLVLPGLAVYVEQTVVFGRRRAAVELFSVICLGLWFRRRWAMPRWCVLAGLIAGTLLLYSTGEYRLAVSKDTQTQPLTLGEIPLFENFGRVLREGGHEVENAALAIAAAHETGHFDFGLFHWNMLVFNYVPGQVVGPDRKEALMLPLHEDDVFALYGHVPHPGSTFTGLADAFRSFWYLGCLKFFLIALVMRKLYLAGLNGHLVAQLLYMLMLPHALHAITHHTQRFFSPWIHLAVFLLPALLLSRTLRRPVQAPLRPCAGQPIGEPAASPA